MWSAMQIASIIRIGLDAWVANSIRPVNTFKESIMGQGTESCGGYDVDYDPYEEGLEAGIWTQRDGSTISVGDMSLRHLENAKRIAASMAECSSFSGDADMWLEWVEVFERAIDFKPKPVAKYIAPSAVAPTRGAKTLMRCHCGTEYQARTADIKRGWALSCSKRCASIRREFGRPAATIA